MHLDFAGAGLILGLIGLAAALFYGLPLKREINRLDRVIAEKEAKMREEERAARPSA
jgi:hypothetical protein